MPFDGIKKVKNEAKPPHIQRKIVQKNKARVDISRVYNPVLKKEEIIFTPQFKQKKVFSTFPEVRSYILKKPSLLNTVVKKTLWAHLPPWPFSKAFTGALAVLIVTVFLSGVWFTLKTQNSAAQDAGYQKVFQPYPITITKIDTVSTTPQLSNEVLFNTPIEKLRNYFDSRTSIDEVTLRKQQLKEFLQSHNSPFIGEADVIASQTHWKLILAISFAESTLGKKCFYNNCSGIGGSQIKSYENVKAWIVDFNRLLEKRYKNKTLEQMCGVYVQPCNPNWLLATKQILSEIEEKNIQ